MPFVTVNKDTVYQFWRDFEARQVAKRTQRKEPRMPVTKSLSEVAWAAVYSLAREMVAAGKAPDTDTAVQTLRLGNHPVYATYLAASAPGAPTPQTAAADIGKVLKAAEPAALAKRRAVEAEINKRAAALVRTGQFSSEMEAWSAVFKADRELYEEYRKSSYADGPLPPAPEPTRTVAPDPPAYALAKRMALELKQNDPWGEHNGKSEQEMIETVLRGNRELYEAVRQESYSRG